MKLCFRRDFIEGIDPLYLVSGVWIRLLSLFWCCTLISGNADMMPDWREYEAPDINLYNTLKIYRI